MKSSTDGGGCFPTGRHYPGIAHLLRVDATGLAEEIPSATLMADLPIVAIDTETTGKNASSDRIVEIACVVWEQGATTERRSWLIHPECPIPQDAVSVHGITDDDVRDCPRFAQIADELLTVLRRGVPLAYNAPFDRAFVLAELERSRVNLAQAPPAGRRSVEWIDPLVWARELHAQEKSRALSDVCSRLGITLEHAHRATSDAEAALLVMHAFLDELRVPRSYGAFIREQRRLAQRFDEERRRWRRNAKAESISS
jgi:DNA polymerase-3 subunit epsilon